MFPRPGSRSIPTATAPRLLKARTSPPRRACDGHVSVFCTRALAPTRSPRPEAQDRPPDEAIDAARSLVERLLEFTADLMLARYVDGADLLRVLGELGLLLRHVGVIRPRLAAPPQRLAQVRSGALAAAVAARTAREPQKEERAAPGLDKPARRHHRDGTTAQ